MNMAEQLSSDGPSTSTPDTLEPAHPEVSSFKVYKPAGSQTGSTPPGTHLDCT
jgi:hypothetical protein